MRFDEADDRYRVRIRAEVAMADAHVFAGCDWSHAYVGDYVAFECTAVGETERRGVLARLERVVGRKQADGAPEPDEVWASLAPVEAGTLPPGVIAESCNPEDGKRCDLRHVQRLTLIAKETWVHLPGRKLGSGQGWRELAPENRNKTEPWWSHFFAAAKQHVSRTRQRVGILAPSVRDVWAWCEAAGLGPRPSASEVVEAITEPTSLVGRSAEGVRLVIEPLDLPWASAPMGLRQELYNALKRMQPRAPATVVRAPSSANVADWARGVRRDQTEARR